MEDQGEKKKLSIGEALEALRKKKAENQAATPGAPAAQSVAASSQGARNIVVPPGFWLDNLQEGVQRSRDRLWDSIAQNPATISDLSRRDLTISGNIQLTAEMLQEVGESAPSASGVSQFSSSGELVFESMEIEEVSMTGSAPVGRFEVNSNLQLEDGVIEEVQNPASEGAPNPMVRGIFKR